MIIFAVLSVTCLSIAVIGMTIWAFIASWPFTIAVEDTTVEDDTMSPNPRNQPYQGRHRFDEAAAITAPLALEPEDRTFLEAVAAQPLAAGPDPFAAPAESTPDAWFGVPNDDTRHLTLAP